MVVAFLSVIAGLAVTGAIVRAGPEFGGPLAGVLSKHDATAVEELHEALAGALVALVAIHVLGVLASSVLERQNLVLGMITGWKRVPAQAVASGAPRRPWLRGLTGATALALGVAAALWIAVLIGFPRRAHAAASPVAAALLLEYEAAARKANPDRLTDRREVEKWFKRNCTQVLGRECTAEEKGHFLTFLLQP